MKGLYSLFDRAIAQWLLPFPAETEQDALRQCKTVVNDKRESNLTKYPEDYDLYHVGYFNEETGELVPSKTIKWIYKLSDLKEE